MVVLTKYAFPRASFVGTLHGIKPPPLFPLCALLFTPIPLGAQSHICNFHVQLNLAVVCTSPVIMTKNIKKHNLPDAALISSRALYFKDVFHSFDSEGVPGHLMPSSVFPGHTLSENVQWFSSLGFLARAASWSTKLILVHNFIFISFFQC